MMSKRLFPSWWIRSAPTRAESARRSAEVKSWDESGDKTFQIDAPDIEVWKARALRSEYVEDALTKEIERLRAIVRVNLLRHVPGATHADIDAILDAEEGSL